MHMHIYTIQWNASYEPLGGVDTAVADGQRIVDPDVPQSASSLSISTLILFVVEKLYEE